MTYVLGKQSLENLKGVHKPLADLVREAIKITTQDFSVNEGLRSLAQQKLNVKNGVSQTLNSYHLTGFAVDLVPYINGKKVWDWEGCYKIAMAMDEAATKAGVARNIRWGGAWDKRLSDFGGNVDEYKKAVQAYQVRHPGPDFLDGPHFEWRT
jgi:peptidoglycan LD-endopeptidase CwlK